MNVYMKIWHKFAKHGHAFFCSYPTNFEMNSERCWDSENVALCVYNCVKERKQLLFLHLPCTHTTHFMSAGELHLVVVILCLLLMFISSVYIYFELIFVCLVDGGACMCVFVCACVCIWMRAYMSCTGRSSFLVNQFPIIYIIHLNDRIALNSIYYLHESHIIFDLLSIRVSFSSASFPL